MAILRKKAEKKKAAAKKVEPEVEVSPEPKAPVTSVQARRIGKKEARILAGRDKRKARLIQAGLAADV